MLHEVLKNKRLQLELATKDLSARTALDPSLISRFEKGERIPTSQQLEKLAPALGLDLESLRIMAYQRQIEKVLDNCEEPIREKVLQGLLNGKQAIRPVSQERQYWLQQLKTVQSLIQQSRQNDRDAWEQIVLKSRIPLIKAVLKTQAISFTQSELELIALKNRTIADRSIQDHLKVMQVNEWLNQAPQALPDILTGIYEGLEKKTADKAVKTVIKELSEIVQDSMGLEYLADSFEKIETSGQVSELGMGTRLLWNATCATLSHLPPVEELAPADWSGEKKLELYLSALVRRARKALDELE